MGIIIKFITRNLLTNKFRTSLLILSLTMSAALFFVANGAATTTMKISQELKRKYVGSSDLVLEANQASPSPFLRLEPALKYQHDMEYAVGVVDGSGIYRPARSEQVRIHLRGIHLEDLEQLSQVSLIAERNLRPFVGNKILVGRPAAETYNLNVGDSIIIEVNGRAERFMISGIAEGRGLFLDDGEAVFMAVPRGTMATVYGAGQAVNGIYVKLRQPADQAKMMSILGDEYKQFTVREAVTQAEIERDASERTDPYKFIVVVLLFMGVYVIYSSSQVIAAERLPLVGTLRSVGATKRVSGMILLGESLVCGILGGVFACLVGIGLLKVMLILTLPSHLKGLNPTIEYTVGQLVATFALAVVVSVISSVMPILRTANLPIKTTIFGLTDQVVKRARWKFVLGLALVTASIVAPRAATGVVALPVSLVSVILPVTAAVLLAPYLTELFVLLLSKPYKLLFGNVGVLAAKNLRENRSILGNISLLAISISSFLVIHTLSYSLTLEMKDLFRNNALFDVMVWVQGDDRNVEGIIYRTPGVRGIFRTYVTGGVEVVNTGSKFETVHGAQKDRFLEYWDINLLDTRPPAVIMEELDSGRNILVTNLMRDKLGLKQGDVITLRLPRGNVPYKVTGFFQSYNSGGSYAIISDRFLRIDTQGNYWSHYGIKTVGDSYEIASDLQRQLADRGLFVRSVDADEQINYEQYKTLFDMLRVFSLLILVISLFGIVNNFLINFLQRRRSIAMMRSVGMSRRQLIGMILVESFSGGLLGAISGAAGGLLMISVMPYFMMAIEQVAPIHLSVGALAACLVVGVVISLIASTSPAVRSSKMNIIEAIKHQ